MSSSIFGGVFLNYFIKLLILKKEEPILLYGFCAETEQPLYDWKRKEIGEKLKVLQYSTIVAEFEINEFKKRLLSKEPLEIIKDHLAVDLKLRPTVLSDTTDLEKERNKPVSRFHRVEEWWNLDKIDLMKRIRKVFYECNDRELRNKLRNLFSILKKECGIDFSLEGGRFGNFEFYLPGKYFDSFEVITNKENSRQITLKKKQSLTETLIVSCATKNEGRWISDEIKFFQPNIDELNFCASEPITRIQIKIWEQVTGELVFVDDLSFVIEINIDNAVITTHRVIQDPWTQELFRSDSKNIDAIQKIENNVVHSKFETLNISVEDIMPWRMARTEGQKLCGIYKAQEVKGAFVPKTSDKTGEIDSFEKVRSYISENGLKKVVLADPYFSVKSVGKLLARISSASVELEIITALSTKDPDTEQNNQGIMTVVKEFLEKNRNLLHSSLIIYNVLQGNKQAFHDRYLVRYFENGRIDGFLLSNSLNSAGQSFPYVIAPLENEVCLEVAEYLKDLINIEYQKSKNKKEQAQIEVLYNGSEESKIKDNTESATNISKLPFLLSGKKAINTAIAECVNLNYFKEDSTSEHFTVLPERMPEIVKIIDDHFESEPETAIIALGEAMYHSYQVTDIVLDCFVQNPESSSKYLVILPSLAVEMEKRQKHDQQPLDSEQYIFWAILNEKAQPSSIYHLLDSCGFVYYSQESYWSSLYNLFLHLDPVSFLGVMEKTSSPLMFSILLNYLALNEYEIDIFQRLINSKWEWMKDLSAQWLWNNYIHEKHEFENVLDIQEPEIQLGQSAYLLSQAAFNLRMNRTDATHEKKWLICASLIERIVKLCNEANILDEKVLTALEKVNDCEKTSECWMNLAIASSLHNLQIRNFLLEKIVCLYESRINSDNLLPYKAEIDKYYIEYVVKAILLLTEDGDNKFDVTKILPWEALFDWTEPYLKDRDYFRWYSAGNRVKWTIELLNAYTKDGCELQGKFQDYWDCCNARACN